MEYNGFKNEATWNVALHLGNDFGWYQIAKAVKRYPQPFLSFRKQVWESFNTTMTSDGVSLWSDDLDTKELDDAIKEF